MDLSDRIKDAVISDVKVRIFEECFPRIEQCLEELTIEQIWHKPNRNSNSVGNLVLHICGNIRQYCMTGIGGHTDIRKRNLEFSEKGPFPKADLKLKMKNLLMDISPVLDSIESKVMIEERKVQGFTMNVTSILIHVTEHLSYHTGQIAYYTKQVKNIDLKFYGDMNLDVTQ